MSAQTKSARTKSARISLCVLAAAAALGAAILAPTTASAGPMGLKVHPHGPLGVVVHPHGPMGIIIKPKPIGWIPHPIGIIIKPHPHPIPWCKWHDCGPHWVPGGETVVTEPIAVTPATPAPVAAAPCTCLTKTYLRDGSVLFQDVCTRESAIEMRDAVNGLAPAH
ncbi:MAG TPA: hypothetical protein VKX28_09105 [Xanthobacteraceae bacterium]|nr:hypothetical protein [Xanthobacteraceae bacterium]